MVRNIAGSVGEALLGLLYPRVCAGCEGPLGGGEQGGEIPVCSTCRDRLERITPPFCERCGEAFDGETVETFRCSNCADRDFHFDYAVAGHRAHTLVRELLHRFKYGKQIHLCECLRALMEPALDDPRLAAIAQRQDGWLLVPVPLHRRRKRERGFNQAAELCRALARRRRWKVAEALRRTRYTAMQARLDRAGRLENLSGAFKLSRNRRILKELEGADILLVDDVLTTGATANECARVLREEGKANKVVVLTVARR